MVKTILVPLDGSPSAENALPSAATLAAATGGRLLLVRPVSARSVESGDSDGWHRRLATAHEELQRCAAKVHARAPFVHVSVSAPVGPLPDAVLDEADLAHADLIVADRRLGALPGAVRAEAGALGAAAVALSRRAEIPLLLLPPQEVGFGAPLRVLVPLDGSPSSEAILPVMVRLGALLPLRITVLHVLPAPGLADGGSLPDEQTQGSVVAALGHALATRRQVSWATAAEYCRRVAIWLERRGVTAQVELRVGDAVEEIGRASLDHGGLLALGLPEALPWRFGYSAERLLRSVPVPVLALRSSRVDHVVPLDVEPVGLPDPLDAPVALGAAPEPLVQAAG